MPLSYLAFALNPDTSNWTLADSRITTPKSQPEANKNLLQIRQDITAIRKQLAAISQDKSLQKERLKLVEIQIGKQNRLLASTQKHLDSLNLQLKTLHKQQTQLKNSLRKQHHYLTRQIRSQYILGRQEYLKILLNQSDPKSMSRVMTYYDYFNQSRAGKIGTLKTTLSELEQVKVNIADASQKLNNTQHIQQQDQQELQTVYAQRQQILGSINLQFTNKNNKLNHLIASERELLQLLDQIKKGTIKDFKELKSRKSFAELKGKLPWPTKGKIRARFGQPKKIGKLRWQGVLINATQGSKVKSIAHGQVVFSDWLRGFGLLTIVDHGADYMSLYAHNQSLYKEKGDWVESNELIASVGKSGGQSKNSLYFEIRHRGKPRNPKIWCKKRRK